MVTLLLFTWVAAMPAREALLRQEIGRVALAQVRAPDVRWQAEQRDCAGYVRFSYRMAFQNVAPERAKAGLWQDAQGNAVAFANAETLVAHSFARLGRETTLLDSMETGDLMVFRQAGSGVDALAAPWHLMMVVRPQGPDRHAALVAYHTGDASGGVRAGSLRDYLKDAPREWQPVPANPAFLGFYRFKEWHHG